jgi:hypothetical protein
LHKISTKTEVQPTIVQETQGKIDLPPPNISAPPFFVAHKNKYVVMVRHVLGTICWVSVNKDTKVLDLTLENKAYLIPKEFEKTELFKLHKKWDGLFDNVESKTQKEKHLFQLPMDTNVEEVSIRRFDHQTCFGWLVELHFEKQLFGADHLRPSASLWELLEEGVKEGRGADEVMEATLKEAQKKKKDETPDK